MGLEFYKVRDFLVAEKMDLKSRTRQILTHFPNFQRVHLLL